MSARGQKPLDLTGRRFGRLLVVGFYSQDRFGHYYWKCRCDCGTETIVRTYSLTRATSQSCGCLSRMVSAIVNVTHGMRSSSEYGSWRSMIRRCLDSKHNRFQYYGGRGIRVCERWLHSFENFLADVGRKPSRIYSLDRFPNRDGNYEPGNVRWATPREQANNRRTGVRHVC